MASWTRRSDSLSSGRGCLIKDQHGCVFQECPGNSEPLALTSRQPHPKLTNLGRIALRERHDEVVGMGGLGRGNNLLLGPLRHTVGNIIAYGVIKQKSGLGDHGNLGAQ